MFQIVSFYSHFDLINLIEDYDVVVQISLDAKEGCTAHLVSILGKHFFTLFPYVYIHASRLTLVFLHLTIKA